MAVTVAVSVAVTSFAAQPYRSQTDTPLFAGTNSAYLDASLLGDPAVMGDASGFRIPSLVNTGDALVAAVDTGSSSADWGDINVAVRRSLDQGQTWSTPMDIALAGPKRKAVTGPDAFYSSFYIDPVMAQAANGDLLMLVDFWPESKGLHDTTLLEPDKMPYVTVDGKEYLALYAGASPLDTKSADAGAAYTVRENGWVYTPQGQRTNYYLPAHHSSEWSYQTIGDLYYAVGEQDYLTETPPLIPQEPVGETDIYAGNIYISKDKPAFSESQPAFVQKQEVGDAAKTGKQYDADGAYECTVTKAAPLRAPLRCNLFVTRSTDDGATWSQPVDITGSVMTADDNYFLGTAPGVGITLQHQQDSAKNGRVVMPVYRLGDSAAIYSDDNGVSWKRAEGYINNIDEWQLIELANGSLMSFGRQVEHDVTPVSYSTDGGETWGKREYTSLQSVRCQKSVIAYPAGLPLPDGLEAGRQYVLASHPTGSAENKNARTNGTVTLGVVEEDGKIKWLHERTVLLEGQFSQLKENQNFFAYSSLAALNDGRIGMFYESQPGAYLSYASFNLEWLMEGEQPAQASTLMSAKTRRIILITAASAVGGSLAAAGGIWAVLKLLQKKKNNHAE